MPFEVTRMPLTVRAFGADEVPPAQLDGIDAERSAILSSETSKAKRGCTLPWPRLGPQGGLLVK